MKNSLKFLNSFRRYEDFLLQYYVKSVQIRSYFWAVFSCIRTEYGDLRSRIRTRNNSVFFTQCPDCKTDGITSCIIIYVIHIHCCQPKVFRKKDVLKIFYNIQAFRPATLSKGDSNTGAFL